MYRIGLPEFFQLDVHNSKTPRSARTGIEVNNIRGVHWFVSLPVGSAGMADKDVVEPGDNFEWSCRAALTAGPRVG